MHEMAYIVEVLGRIENRKIEAGKVDLSISLATLGKGGN